MRQALATDVLDPAGVYFGTSNGSVYASRDEGETWGCIAPTCQRFRRSRRCGPLMRAPAVVRLPALLKALFPNSERVVKIEAETVEDVMNGLEARWPGMRDRLCDRASNSTPYQRVRRRRTRASRHPARTGR